MKGEDIDKLFRDKLGGAVEPTTEEDWKAFEASLDQKGGFINTITIVLALLLLLGGGISTYFLGGFNSLNSEPITKVELNSEKQNSSNNNSQEKTSSKKKLSEDENLNIRSSIQNSQHNSIDAASITAEKEESEVENYDTAESRITENVEQKVALELSKNKESGVEPTSKTADPSAKIVATSNSRNLNSEGQQKVQLEDSKAREGKNRAENSNRIDLTDNKALGSLSSASNYASNKGSISQTQEVSDFDLTVLLPLSGIVNRDYDPHSLIDSEQLPYQKPRQRFGAFAYLKAEHNVLLRNGFAGGLGLNLPIGKTSNWSGNLSLSGGVGFQRTGTIAWRQTSEEVNYGFDKYVAETELITERLDLIQVPLYLNYSFAGLHQVFLGVESSFVIGSSQSLSIKSPFDDTQANESGNLFDTKSPSYIYFFQVGYGYSISERYQIQTGVSYSNQTWETSQNTPLGIFLKLNYQIR